MPDAITLIGMPGAGKSTLGVLLAKELARPFIDTDLLIQQRAGMTLQAYLDQHGFEALRELEQQVLLTADLDNAVIATGGSVVYSTPGMQRLQTLGPCIYLRITPATLEERVNNAGERGLAVKPGTSLNDLYHERQPLYARWASHTVDCDRRFPGEIVTQLKALVEEYYGT